MYKLFVLALLTLGFVSLRAQQSDTLRIDSVATKQIEVQDSVVGAQQDTVQEETRKERRARKKAEKEREKYYYKGIKKDSARLEIERLSRVAWRRSLIVPGWGQYTNKGLWWVKVPVIYGGFVTGYLVFDYWQWYYKKFLNELDYRISNNGEMNDPDLMGFRDMNGLVTRKDYGRRNRDLTILVTVGWWGLNVVEAYVDSMLKNRWDIGADMSFKVSPTLMPTYGAVGTGSSFMQGYNVTPGVKLTMSLK